MPARSRSDPGATPADGAARVYLARRARRVRNVAVWSIAFFVASVPVALLGGGMMDEADGRGPAGSALAMLCWLVGFATGAWAFVLAFRHWDQLPQGTRWLASTPLLVVLFLLALSMVLIAIA